MADLPVLWIAVIMLGLMFGSFANVLICRLPENESVVKPRSRCPSCANTLRWYHNIPVLSWIALRGRCGFCGTRISWVYPTVELMCAALFAAFYARYGISVTTIGFWYLSITLVAVFFIDLKHQIIPDRLTYPGAVVGIVVAILSPHLKWWESLVGAVGGVAIFIGIAYLGHFLFRKDSLGGGDVKLAAVLGAFLGVGKLLTVFVLSAAIGLVISIAVMAVSPSFRRDRMIPFGPFLATAAVLVCFYGEAMVGFYVRNFLQ